MPDIFSPKQKKLLIDQPKKINLAWGVTGSGKSFIVNLRAYTDFQLSPPRSVGIVTGVSMDTIKANVIEPLIKLDPQHLYFAGNELHFPGGRKWKCIGAFTENSDKRVQGIPESWVTVIDEAPKQPQSFLEMAIDRAKAPRGKGGMMEMTPVWLTGNAGHPGNYIKKKFIDDANLLTIDKDIRESDDLREWVFWATDNPKNDPEYIAKKMAGATGLFLQRMYLNQWVASSGGYFDRIWCQEFFEPPSDVRRVRFWDLGHTAKTVDNDPDYTATVRMSRDKNGIFYIEDFSKVQMAPGDRDKYMRMIASKDPSDTVGGIEVEPGHYGKPQVQYLISYLAGYTYMGIPMAGRGDKVLRFSPLSAQCKAGNVRIKKAVWNDIFYNDLESFDGLGKIHDDPVDAASGAFYMLTHGTATIEME